MEQSRFTKAQVIGILKEQESGLPTAEACRKHGISSVTCYKYKARFGGMDVSEAQRLKALDDENAKLKKLALNNPFRVRLQADTGDPVGVARSERRR